MASRPSRKPRRKARVRKHLSYSVFDVAQELGVCRNTVRRWLSKGLKTVDGQKPFLIRGADLNAFLATQRNTAKRPCRPGQIFCLKCREARAPVPGLIDFVWNGRTTGNLKALCKTCGSVMNRRCNRARVAEVLPNLDVTMRRA